MFENLELALRGRQGRAASAPFARRTAEQQTRIEEVLGLIGLRTSARTPPGLLSHGEKQWLEIGMLLVQDPGLLLLDEPVAGMTRRGDGAHRRAASQRWPASTRWSSSSTTWSSWTASRAR